MEETIVDEKGAPLANAQMLGHVLDGKWLNQEETLTTDASGFASLSFTGQPHTGTFAFFIDSVTRTDSKYKILRLSCSPWGVEG